MKIAIITIYSINYGNRLQNYALAEYLGQYAKCETIYPSKKYITCTGKLKRIIRIFRGKTKEDMFARFNKNISFSQFYIDDNTNERVKKYYDYFIAGSDQIWNPLFPTTTEREFLSFADPTQRITYAASIGIDELPAQYYKIYKQRINNIPFVSMREERGAEIVKQLTGREVDVVLDPTLLLNSEQWRKVEKKSKYQPTKNYIFQYYLGKNDEYYNDEIEQIAEKYHLEIFKITNKERRAIGPAEFISLLDHSSFVCTDSFHGTVFSILFQKPFITLERPYENGYGNMNSRIDTILSMFHLEERRINKKRCITNDLMSCDFSQCEKILEEQRKKSDNYIKKALHLER